MTDNIITKKTRSPSIYDKSKSGALIIPKDLASRWETIVETSATGMLDRRTKMLEAVGERPYKGLPVEENERLARYREIREDPLSLVEILKANTRIKEDGRILVKRKLISSMIEMEQQLKE